MFPPDSSGLDMGELLQQAQQMQERLMAAQQDLSTVEVTGTAGGGLVRATVIGTGELTAVHIDPSVVDPQDVETLGDLVVAAVRDAHAQVQRQAQERLGSLDADMRGLLGEVGDDDVGDDEVEEPGQGSPNV